MAHYIEASMSHNSWSTGDIPILSVLYHALSKSYILIYWCEDISKYIGYNVLFKHNLFKNVSKAAYGLNETMKTKEVI